MGKKGKKKKLDSPYCKCHRPRIVIRYNDMGHKVRYCDKCWKPMEGVA